MPFADLGDVRLFYTDDGDHEAPVVLLVHGFGADSHDWVWHIPELSRTRRVIAVDLRGHGYSSAPESGYRPQDFAQDLVNLLDHLGIDRVIAFGHSMGGMIVSTLAVEHSSRITALVCVDPGYGQPDATAPYLGGLAEQMRAEPYRIALQNDEWCYTPVSPAFLRAWHARKILGTAPHALVAAFTAMFAADEQFGLRSAAEKYLAGRNCPVLAFHFDPAQSAWESSLFPSATSHTSEAVTWQGSGHRLHAERPAEFLLVVKNWLDKLDKEKLA
ncbi:MAG TPA: alpha/beta hydrolase [Streptosporangiaceae bacterium]|nr:alpha/beta hydrolase [Streptosporangiaceae bacterium]